ncbi:MAG: hypothetical protein DI550_24040, partial [Escherichia coli]
GTGHRLGYGQGFYDRALHQRPAALRVAVCYPFQVRSEIPHDSHDEPVPRLQARRLVLVAHQGEDILPPSFRPDRGKGRGRHQVVVGPAPAGHVQHPDTAMTAVAPFLKRRDHAGRRRMAARLGESRDVMPPALSPAPPRGECPFHDTDRHPPASAGPGRAPRFPPWPSRHPPC